MRSIHQKCHSDKPHLARPTMTPMRSVGSWNIWASGWPTPGRLPGLIRPLGSHRYTRIPPHSFRPLRKKTTPSSRQPTGTVEPPRQAYGLPLVVPVCSISGRPTRFFCLFDLTLSRAAHPGAALPSDSPGSHNILYVFLLDAQLAACDSLFVRKQFPGIFKFSTLSTMIFNYSLITINQIFLGHPLTAQSLS
jgi:hypothetical protein